MEFEADYLGNTDMFTLFFGQDEGFSVFQGERKSHDVNVLVEKFPDYDEVETGTEIDANIEDVDSLFDSEWLTSKIDLKSYLPEQLDGNFNWVSISNEIHPSTLVIADTDSSLVPILRDINIEKISETDATSTDESEECGPTSPEQHVPDLDAGIGEQFKVFLENYLAAAKTSFQDDISLEDPTIADGKVPLKRKMSDEADPASQGTKAKVKTPEQKQRKRLQNRNAATRYRSKKRSEQETLNAKCQELENENKELQKKIESKQQEVQYLKSLIIDVFSKKTCRNVKV